MDEILCSDLIIIIYIPFLRPEYSSLPVAKSITHHQPYSNLRARFKNLSEEAYDVLNRMLTYDPKKRITGILFYSILFYSILFYSILSYSILFYSILFYSILFYSILFYSILFYSIYSIRFAFYSILFL